MAARRLAIAMGVVLGLAFGIALIDWGTPWTISPSPDRGVAYQLLGYWNGTGARSGPFEQPFGVAVAPSGDVYVTDARHRVVHLSSIGRAVGEWGGEGNGAGQFSDAVAIAVGPDGTVYVSDYDLDRIQAFTPDGHFLRSFGSSGAGAGQLDAPAGVAVDRSGSVYAADFYNHRVQRFRPDGSFDRTIGHPGRFGAGALHHPTGVAILPDSNLLVADAYNHQLQWFDRSGKPLRRIGYHLLWLWPRPAAASRGFRVPTDAVSTGGLIHVTDSGNHRIVMLSMEGRFVGEWKVADANPLVYSPEHIASSPDGSTIYATDLAANRVIVLRIVRRGS